MRRMNPDLVGAPTVQLAMQEAVGLPHPLGREIGARLFALTVHGHASTHPRIAPDRRINTKRFLDPAVTQRQVLALDRARGQLRHQIVIRRQGLGHHHQSRGVFVQSMHDARSRQLRRPSVMGQQGIQNRARPVACGRMHHPASRLVHHQQGVVLEHAFDGQGLGLERHRMLRQTPTDLPPTARDASAARPSCRPPPPSARPRPRAAAGHANANSPDRG